MEENKYPKTFKELFEGTGIESKVDNDGNTKLMYEGIDKEELEKIVFKLKDVTYGK